MAGEREAYEILHVSPLAGWPAVRAAYRTLARRYHPDGSAPDSTRMAGINAAYERLERAQRPAAGAASPTGATGGAASPTVAMGPGISGSWGARAMPGAGSLMRRVMAARHGETPVLDFGQYSGWRIADVAEYDPGYLRWLSRHSSGVRFRSVIEQILGTDPDIGRRAAFVR